MAPFHEEDELELGKCDVGIQQLKLRGTSVFFKLLFPLFLSKRGDGTSDGLPLSNTEPGFCKTRKTTQDNNSKNKARAND